MKVLIIGASGQLGSELVKVFADAQSVPLAHRDLEICDPDATRATLTAHRPDAVINTAAFHRVDDCEDAPERAFAVNAIAVRSLAQVCADLQCALMHMSTDYVFGGAAERDAPYAEDDLPNPVNVYGVSKLAGEYFVRNLCPRHFVVRSTGLYGVAGSSGKGGNFVETMTRLTQEGKPIRVVADQVLTPTYASDLAAKMKELLETQAYGLYHITSAGCCSWYEFAAHIFKLQGLEPDFEPTTSAAIGARARRPAYSVLAHRNLLGLGLPDLRPWPEALAAYLREKQRI